ncbi:MAG: glycosyltransferase [Rubrivivax sp.]|nr:glycosyltransferase [Rubrivivax sp.]
MNPKISVVFPLGDREAFLAEALESVLAQDFADFELLAVLDGVSPPTQAIVEAYRDTRPASSRPWVGAKVARTPDPHRQASVTVD